MLTILYIIIAIILAVIITCITIFFVNKSIQKKYQNFVLQNSVCLKQLEEINRHYNFYPYICFDQTHIYDNENYFNMISCKDYLIYQLQYLWKKYITKSIKSTIIIINILNILKKYKA